VKPRRNTLLAILSLTWVALIVSLYFVLHKPFSLELALGLGRAFFRLLAAWGVVSVAGGLGAWIHPAGGYHPLGRLALQAALGLGILSIVVLILGATLGLSLSLLWLLLIVPGVLLWRHVLGWWVNWGEFRQIWGESDFVGRAIALVVGLLLLSTMITALAPPLKFDALVYHLTLPRAYLQAGRIAYLPWMMFWGMPQVAEMLYTWTMALAGVQAAVVLGWVFGLVALTGMFGFVSRMLDSPSAWIATAALLAGFTTASSLAWGYVDWMSVLFGCALLASIERWAYHQSRTEIILAGVFAGFALGTKYTAGVLLVCGFGMIAWLGRKSTLSVMLRNLLLFGTAGILLSSPWWIKNLIATGSPFYPFFYPAGAIDQFRLGFYQGQPIWGAWTDALLLPFGATLRGLDGTPGFNASIGPLLLALGALAWVGWGQRSEDQRCSLLVGLIISGVGLAVWALASRFSGLLIQTRLYFSLFPAFAFLAGAGFNGLRGIKIPGVRIERVMGLLVLLVLGLNLVKVSHAVLRQNAPQYLFSITTREEYLLINLGWYAWVMESIDELPDDSRVLMLWEPRGFYCTPKCTPDEILDRWVREVRSGHDIDVILKGWRDHGFTHLLYHREGADFIQREDTRYQAVDWAHLEKLLTDLPAPLEFGDVYALYPLTSP